jgi:hypothetical protein
MAQGDFGSAIGDFGTAASDLFAGFGAKMADSLKAEGFQAEATNYGMASTLAGENAQFTAESTMAKAVQTQRQQELGIGKEVTAIAGNGFTMGGSSEDILRSAHEQAGLETALVQQQGNITEAGYQEQAAAYKVMQQYATDAAAKENSMGNMAEIAGIVGAGFKVAQGAAMLAAL